MVDNRLLEAFQLDDAARIIRQRPGEFTADRLTALRVLKDTAAELRAEHEEAGE